MGLSIEASTSIGILVVEDDIEIRETLCTLFSNEGYQSIGAGNGLEALEILQTRPELSVSVILLDLLMPEMDGWTFREKLLRNPAWEAIPVIVMTASKTGTESQRKLRAARSIAKPMDLDQLLSEIESLIHGVLC